MITLTSSSQIRHSTEKCRENLKHIHIPLLQNSRKNKIINTEPNDIYSSKQTLPHHIHTKLAQLKVNKLPLL